MLRLPAAFKMKSADGASELMDFADEFYFILNALRREIKASILGLLLHFVIFGFISNAFRRGSKLRF